MYWVSSVIFSMVLEISITSSEQNYAALLLLLLPRRTIGGICIARS